MSRHRHVTVRPGQDPLDLLGRVVWQRRRPNGDEVVVRVVEAPMPHARLEVWRGKEERAVVFTIDELPAIAAALLTAPAGLRRAS